MKASIWTKSVGIAILAFFLQFKSPIVLLDRIEGSPLSLNFISTTYAEDDVPMDSENGTIPETEPDSDNHPEPEPESNPKPELEPEKKPDSPPKPAPTQKPDASGKPSQHPKPEAKPDLNKTPKPNTTIKPTQKPIIPVVKENIVNRKDTSKSTGKESNPLNSDNTNISSKNENESQVTTNENNEMNEEEIETEPVNVEEEEININELSIKQLIDLLEKGELKWESKADKYLIMLTEGKEQRELTTEEALKLGIIEADSEKDELIVDEDEVEEIDDENEVKSDNIEEVQLLSDNKNEKSKAPFYISVIGLITVLSGSLMYLIQWRKG